MEADILDFVVWPMRGLVMINFNMAASTKKHSWKRSALNKGPALLFDRPVLLVSVGSCTEALLVL